MKQKVLVTGGAGYIGSTLVRLLVEEGYAVRVLDRFFFGPESMKALEGNPDVELVKGDVRWVEPSIMDGIYAVMDLAALSNDPAGELNPERTLEINWKGRERMANLAKKAGVPRYILASSCSIYGFREGVCDETTPSNPLTTYAEANFRAEGSAFEIADANFCATALRQATVYGASHRMRFDLAINGMTLGFFKNGKIPVLRDGTQWRPFVHVKDTSRAFVMALRADPKLVGGQIFNVGDHAQNVQILPLAKTVAEAIGMDFSMEWYGEPDHRSYQISFEKIGRVLGYKTNWTPGMGAKEIMDGLRAGTLTDSDITYTLKWYKALMTWHDTIRSTELNGRML